MNSKSRSVVPIATAIFLASLVIPAAQADICDEVGSPDECVERQDMAKNAVSTKEVKNNSLRAKDLRDEPGAAYRGLDDQFELPTSGADLVAVSLTLNAPQAGYVIVSTSGYFDFNGEDGVARCSITEGSVTYLPFTNLIIIEAAAYATGGGPYASFGATRGFSVSKGANSFQLLCDTSFSDGTIEIGDPQLTAIYVPTAYGTHLNDLESGEFRSWETDGGN